MGGSVKIILILLHTTHYPESWEIPEWVMRPRYDFFVDTYGANMVIFILFTNILEGNKCDVVA